MNLDELISILQEAKEHFVPGKSEVIVDDNFIIDKIQYDSKHVYLKTQVKI